MGSQAAEIIGATRISTVYRALTGTEPRPTGRDSSRASATWRGGKGLNVSLNDETNTWHDFVSGEGGGLLDLVVRVRGGQRYDALRWLASLIGVPLDDHPFSTADRARWRREHAEAERVSTEAAYFEDAARQMAEWALEELSPVDPERAGHTTLLTALRVSPEAEYRAWLDRDPTWATALVNAGREREKRLARMLLAYIAEVDRAV